MKVSINRLSNQLPIIRAYLQGEIELAPFYSKIIAALAAADEKHAVVGLNNEEQDWIRTAEHDLAHPLIWWVISSASQINLIIKHLMEPYRLVAASKIPDLQVLFHFDNYPFTIIGNGKQVTVETIAELRKQLQSGIMSSV